MSATNVMHAHTHECAIAPAPHINITSLPTPRSLTLRFSQAADLPRVEALFAPPQKDRIDPTGYVRRRTHEELANPIANGDAVLAQDENGQIRCFAMASHYEDLQLPKRTITEVGAVMCDVAGVGLAKTALAALALKQSLVMRHTDGIHARVRPCNTPSLKLFRSSLGWQDITRTERSTMVGDILEQNGVPPRRENAFFEFTRATQSKSTAIIDTCMDTGSLRSKCGAVNIPVTLLDRPDFTVP